jgi:methionyl-tRNA formyltransferase
MTNVRIALVSYGPEQFSVLHETCEAAGHVPVVYAVDRGTPAARVTETIPPGMDLILPGSAEGLGRALSGYDLDLGVVYGFPWKIPATVLRIPRLGFVNIHSSMLPKYRGPMPVLWAIRNGDPDMGLTIHRMDENFDTGPILAQQDGIPLADDVTAERLWLRIRPVIRRLLTVALDRVSRGDPGEPQNDEGTSYAGFLEPEFGSVDWSRTSREIHDQVRTFRYMGGRQGPTAKVGDHWLKVLRTQLTPMDGFRVECADGPIWIVESEPADLPGDQ